MNFTNLKKNCNKPLLISDLVCTFFERNYRIHNYYRNFKGTVCQNKNAGELSSPIGSFIK